MFILKYLNIYLVQNKGAAAACLTAILLAERGEIDIYIYSNSSLPQKDTFQIQKRGRYKIPIQPTAKSYKITSQTKTKPSKLWNVPFP